MTTEWRTVISVRLLPVAGEREEYDGARCQPGIRSYPAANHMDAFPDTSQSLPCVSWKPAKYLVNSGLLLLYLRACTLHTGDTSAECRASDAMPGLFISGGSVMAARGMREARSARPTGERRMHHVGKEVHA